MPDGEGLSESDLDEYSDSGGEDEPSVIVQLAARVQDGTRCRTGSLDMCIQGKCQVSLVLNYFNREFNL